MMNNKQLQPQQDIELSRAQTQNMTYSVQEFTGMFIQAVARMTAKSAKRQGVSLKPIFFLNPKGNAFKDFLKKEFLAMAYLKEFTCTYQKGDFNFAQVLHYFKHHEAWRKKKITRYFNHAARIMQTKGQHYEARIESHGETVKTIDILLAVMLQRLLAEEVIVKNALNDPSSKRHQNNVGPIVTDDIHVDLEQWHLRDEIMSLEKSNKATIAKLNAEIAQLEKEISAQKEENEKTHRQCLNKETAFLNLLSNIDATVQAKSTIVEMEKHVKATSSTKSLLRLQKKLDIVKESMAALEEHNEHDIIPTQKKTPTSKKYL